MGVSGRAPAAGGTPRRAGALAALPSTQNQEGTSLSDTTAMTKDGLDALRKEIEHLETVARAEIAERIKTAREWGDLKENAEYHDAKNDQALLETKIARLIEKLRSAVTIEGTADPDIVGFGSRVEVLDEVTGKPATYTLVGTTEADPAAGRLSIESPVAKALVGQRAGGIATVFTPRGERKLKVVTVGA